MKSLLFLNKRFWVYAITHETWTGNNCFMELNIVNFETLLTKLS